MTEPAFVEVTVWDWPVRVVHWAIVVLVASLIATGLMGNEALDWHIRFGEALLALLLFRIAWGFVGSRNARFSTFLRGPRPAIDYLRSLRRPPPPPYTTHNPAGALMVVALLGALAFQIGTGLFTNDDVLAEGPFVKFIDKELSDSLSWLHRRGWWVVAGLTSIHIVAVVSYFAVLNENLIYPMVSGTKRLPPTFAADSSHGKGSGMRAVVLLGLCFFTVWWMVSRL